MSEDAGARLKRMTMRSWRRGTKEMDLILGPFADAHLAEMSTGDLAEFDRLLDENDQDLYAWITGADAAPASLSKLIRIIGGTALSGHQEPG